MTSEKLLSLSDFEWASAARYIVYISKVAGLKEINSEHVNSLPLGRLGADKLLKQRGTILKTLEGNISKLEIFTADNKGDLDANELAIIRSVYIQHRDSIKTVKAHLEVIKFWVSAFQGSFFGVGGGQEDDQLF